MATIKSEGGTTSSAMLSGAAIARQHLAEQDAGDLGVSDFWQQECAEVETGLASDMSAQWFVATSHAKISAAATTEDNIDFPISIPSAR